MNSQLIIGSVLYLALLFAIAYFAEYRGRKKNNTTSNAWVYALSMAVYCTGWTYYGSVGRLATKGIEFLTIYLGPTLMCTLFVPVLLKIIRICKTQHINSLADFISTRYGKNFSLGIIVTICCVLGTVPYIALQLKAIGNSFRIVSETNNMADHTLLIAAVLTVFIILFGTRTVDTSEKHTGLINAIAFESVIKLVAFISVGLFVTYHLFDGFGDLMRQAAARADLRHLFVLSPNTSYTSWVSTILLSMVAVILLPRQFQVSVVENTDERHLKKAIWLFPLYLFIINIFVIPIGLGGILTLGNTTDADTYVLSLPLHFNHPALGLFVYIGGFSAASGMVIVETIALATMVSNHLVLPGLFSLSAFKTKEERSLRRTVLYSRRLSIILMVAMAYFYNKFIAGSFSLVSIGLVSMAAVAQLAPAMIGALYWRRASRKAAVAGIVSGFLIWAYTLVLPSFVNSGLLKADVLSEGPLGISWLKPDALFGLDQFDLITHSLFWSLLVNTTLFVVISVYTKLQATEIYQAEVFIDVLKFENSTDRSSVWKGTAYLPDLTALLENFLGRERTANLLRSYAQRHRISLDQQKADPRIVSFAEKILSGVIGSSSARIMVSSVTKEEEISIDEVLSIVRESQQVLELNKELRKKSAELTRASDMLKQANEQLTTIDQLKDEFLYTVTHELRTPLTSIRALAEILYDNPDMDEEQRQHYLDGVIRETERLTHLITQVLNLERYESGRQSLHVSSVNLGKLLQDAVSGLQPLAAEKGTRIFLRSSDTMLLVRCDGDLISQVVYNLLSNAIKFCPQEGGEVHIATMVSYDEVEVRVKDNGKGIPPELHELVFDKFFQARNQTLRKPEGSGLGLAISRRIVEMHNGRISVESTPGKGACFVFVLPFG